MSAMDYLWGVLFYGWCASELYVLLGTRTRKSTGEVKDGGSLQLLWPTITLSITAGLWYGASHPHTVGTGTAWLRIDSVAMIALGLAIRWSAIVSLGKSFSANVAVHATQTIYKSGLFRYVRHPSYTGLILIFCAIGFRTRNWLAMAILVVPAIAALLYRIHVEERVLSDAFGPDYVEYCKGTKRLIPGVY